MNEFFIGVGDIHEFPDNIASIPGIGDSQALIISGDLTTHGGAAAGRRVLDTAMAAAPRILAQAGNMDSMAVEALLDEHGVNIHARAMVLDLPSGLRLGLLGLGASTPTPFGTPNEHPESRMQHWLEQAYSSLGEHDALLLVSHDPPHGTAVDMVGGRHVGCHAVRAFIERVQPDICLSGHIHESSGTDLLGRTLLVNPGPLPSGGYVRIDIRNDCLMASLERI